MAHKPSLKALTAAALAVPGMADAQVQTDYLFAHYSEGDLPASSSASGTENERYAIDTHSLRMAKPQRNSTWLGTLTYESMSGASPWWVQPDANGDPVQVMSGASISEERIVLQASYAYEGAQGMDWVGSLGYSDEDDYQAVSGGLELIKAAQHPGLVYSGGLQFSSDQLNPVRGASSQNVIDSASKDTLNAFAGISWDASDSTAVQLAASLTWHDGYLSDPYKRVFLIDQANTVPDSRPNKRMLWSINSKLRHYLGSIKTALRADYRYFFDDWGIRAHTVKLSSNTPFASGWSLQPSVRWSSQSQADFYAVYFDSAPANGLQSSDYRLSPFGALSARLDVSKEFSQAKVGVGLEWYEADASYALESVALENPGLIDYMIVNVRVTWVFGDAG
ncbi:MAG: DUF3570 domain-containing protein [Oceanococcus sp.]